MQFEEPILSSLCHYKPTGDTSDEKLWVMIKKKNKKEREEKENRKVLRKDLGPWNQKSQWNYFKASAFTCMYLR